MKSIKFANGKKFEIIECYNNGNRFIEGETRQCREIVVSDSVIGGDELEALLKDKANLEVIEVYMNEDREIKGEIIHLEDTEVLEGYVYVTDGRYDFKGERRFTIGQRTAMEIENEEAIATIDELLLAMEG